MCRPTARCNNESINCCSLVPPIAAVADSRCRPATRLRPGSEERFASSSTNLNHKRSRMFRRANMRNAAVFFLMTCALGQALGQPTVRDTYVLAGNPRVMSLRDNLVVVVCKTDYDAWLKDQKDQKPPILSLYMDGLLMKGPEAVRPLPATDEEVQRAKPEVKKECTEQSDGALAAAT